MLDKLLDKWNQWKIPIIIVVFAASVVFSMNYSSDSPEHIVVGDKKIMPSDVDNKKTMPSDVDNKKTMPDTAKQCYSCHQNGKMGNKSIFENIGDGNKEKMTYNSQPGNIASSETHSVRSIQPINSSNISEEDKKFISLIIESDKIVTKDIMNARNAANNSNYKNFETSGTNLKLDSQRYLNRVRNINISYSLKNLSDEYIQMLEDFYNVGKYIESGATSPFSKDIEKSIQYLREGTKHMNNIRDVLKASGITQINTNITKSSNR